MPTPRITARRLSTIPVVLLLAVVLGVVGVAAGFAAKAPCLTSTRDAAGQVSLNWGDYLQYRRHCYSDTIPLYSLERLDQGGFPYKTAWQDPGGGQDRYMEYPVLTGLLQYAVMVVTKQYLAITGQQANPDPPEVVVYFVVMSLVLGVAWLGAVLATAALTSRPVDVALVALSPLVAVHLFTNFDALAVALAAGGLLAWARGRPVLAGLLLGVGAAAKLYPLFVLGPLLVLCLRAGRMPDWWRAAAAGAVGWLAINLPVALLYPRGWWEFFRLNSTRPADHDSVYTAISVLTGWPGFDGPLTAGEAPRVLNLVSLTLFALACAAVAWLAWRAPTPPRLAPLVFLVVAAFLLTNKVWSPQYSLWLVPLAVLALPRVIPLLTWMVVDAALWWPRLGYFLGMAEPGEGNAPETFVRVVLLRDALVVLLCVLVVRAVLWPQTDPHRPPGHAPMEARSAIPI